MKEFKDAIIFLENCIHRGEEDNLQVYEVKYNHWMKKIIKLLKQGEKSKEEEQETKKQKIEKVYWGYIQKIFSTRRD